MSNLYCHLPWTEMHISDDSVSPCCLFKKSYIGSPNEYLKSDFLIDIKKQMTGNQPPKNCSACTIAEEKNGHSFRMLHNNFRPDLVEAVLTDPTQDYIENISILTSNICNLKCLPCCSGASYTRMTELKKLNLTNYNPKVQHISDEFINNITDVDFKKITVLGGEPFYDQYCLKLLETLVKSQRSKEIELDINTNCTNLDNKTVKFLSDNFKFIQIKASLDGVGIVNDYLRYPSNWATIEQSLEMLRQYKNINIIVTTALSNLALIKYYELVEWAINFGINDLFLTPVSDPEQLAVLNLPINVKKLLEIKYLNLKESLIKSNKLTERTLYCIDTAINSCQDLTDYDFLPTVDWLKKHDNLRGNNFFNVFSELIAYAET